MKKVKCIIVDDEFLARALLQGYVNKIPGLELVATCSDCMQAMEVLQSNDIDLMFLDIQMPDLRGTDFVKTLINKPQVIFTTAYSEYAVESYDLQASDYLLKPIEFDRFLKAVNKVTDKKSLSSDDKIISTPNDNFILIKADHGVHKLKFDDIVYVEGLKEYVGIYNKEGKKIVALKSLTKLEEELSGDFMRVHRSYIVNTKLVDSLYGNQVIIGKTNIPIGKSYKEAVLSKIFNQS